MTFILNSKFYKHHHTKSEYEVKIEKIYLNTYYIWRETIGDILFDSFLYNVALGATMHSVTTRYIIRF